MGTTLWISTKTRPNIAWAQSLFASSLARDLTESTQRARHILQYLLQSAEYGLWCRRLEPEPLTEYQVYTDISWAPVGERNQEASVQYVGLPGANVVSWHSTRQDLVAMSTCESELIGASSGLAKAFPHQLLMEEITQASAGLVLGVDNMPAIRQVRLGSESSDR